MGTWTGPAAIDALKTAIEARANIVADKVKVFSADPGDAAPANEYIALLNIEGAQAYATWGTNTREDDYQIIGGVFARKPGAGETPIKAARDRAGALLAEVEAALRGSPNLGGVVMLAQMRDFELHQLAISQGRVAIIDFQVGVRARL